jgi:phosphinothricin acetyltransferase
VIRAATAADAAAVAALWNHWIRDTLVTFNAAEKSEAEVADLIASRQAAGQAFLVAEEGGCLGFASYAQFRGGVGYARTMEHTVLLAPEARGRGVGRALMAAVEDHARGAGVHSLFGGVSSANPEGRAFHLALGFAEVAVLREVGWKWGRFLDLHLMQKIL